MKFLECPIGEIITNLSLLLCNPGNHVENDQCPQGSECLKSETNFTQNAEQPNYICCKIWIFYEQWQIYDFLFKIQLTFDFDFLN